MSINDFPRLCGGTVYILLLAARGQRTAKRDNANGKTDGLSQPELLVELVRIIKPSFNPPAKPSTLKKNVGGYRKCEDNGGTYFAAVFESSDIDVFDLRIKSEYHNVVSAMSELIERFVSDDKVEWLFKAFLEVIGKDTSIDKNFIIDGKQMSKSEVLNIDNISLASFALGVWHYVVMNVKDNTVGQATFNNWHTKKGDTNSEWVFYSDIGNEIKRAITIIPFLDKSAGTATNGHDFIDENEAEIEDEPHVFEKTAEQPTSTTQQVIINGNVFNAKNQFFGNVENVFDS